MSDQATTTPAAYIPTTETTQARREREYRERTANQTAIEQARGGSRYWDALMLRVHEIGRCG